jgi:organic radical activating enzyme
VRYCCHANGSPSKGILTDESGEVINLGTHKLNAGLDSRELMNVRLQMLSGEKPLGCSRCYEEEDVGLPSRRESELSLWQQQMDYERARTLTKADGSIANSSQFLSYLDLRFGNRCNLACRMCGPTESHLWYQIHPKVWGENQFQDIEHQIVLKQQTGNKWAAEHDPYNWHEKDQFWHELGAQLPFLRRLYFAGGEPLLIEPHYELLNTCIEQGYAKNISLEYNTNLITLTKRCLDLWSHFKSVEIGVSVDGVGPLNNYIRHLSQWETLAENLHTLDKSQGPYKLWLSPTIQVYNLIHITDLMNWVIKSGFSRINQGAVGSEIMTPHPLYNPNFLSIKVFSAKAKKYIASRLIKEINKGKELIHSQDDLSPSAKSNYALRYKSLVESFIAIMNSEDLSHLKQKLLFYTRKLDQIHKSRLEDVSPLTNELINS